MSRPTSGTKPGSIVALFIWIPVTILAIAAGSGSRSTAKATPAYSTPPPTVAAALATVPPPPATYLIRPGDGWFKIANDHGIAMPQLLAANDATVDTVIHPGDRLVLPTGSTITASRVSAASIQAAPVATAAPAAAAPTYDYGASGYGAISPRTGLPRTEYVHGYTRKNGTYVQPYYRSRRK